MSTRLKVKTQKTNNSHERTKKGLMVPRVQKLFQSEVPGLFLTTHGLIRQNHFRRCWIPHKPRGPLPGIEERVASHGVKIPRQGGGEEQQQQQQQAVLRAFQKRQTEPDGEHQRKGLFEWCKIPLSPSYGGLMSRTDGGDSCAGCSHFFLLKGWRGGGSCEAQATEG